MLTRSLCLLPLWIAGFAACTVVSLPAASAPAPCRIEVVEKGTGWPVPLVELETTNKTIFVTDNAGVVAFDLPAFMGRETWLTVRSDGYEVDKDPLGNRGFRFTPTPGGTKRVEVRRTNVAKRLGRLTGASIFGESQKLGERLDWKETGVTGQDTVCETFFKGRLYWGWGDTDLFPYALGLFKTSGATTPAQPLKSFEPPLALVYDYFRDAKGSPRNLIDIESPGPVWVGAYTVLPDRLNKEHLVCTYTKLQGLLDPSESGLAEWDEATNNWRPIKTIWKKGQGDAKPVFPNGQSALWIDPAGRRWMYFGGWPNLRCPATLEAYLDPTKWEKVNNPDSLTGADGSNVGIAAASIAWSPYRKRWTAIIQQKFGKPSNAGEAWYAEGDTPAGPWGKAVKVVSHKNYTYYNPMIHPNLAPGAKFILFDGTYTTEFADHARPTAAYNYNQILYRLDLDDPALAPAQSPR